jgi:DNA repair photolyase
VLEELNRVASLGVTISIPFWNADHARAIEPYVATPVRRIRTVEKLAARGIAVNVNVAPIIPGLNDEDIGNVLEAAARAGARSAAMVLLRLPGPVRDVFERRLRAALPLRAERILARIRETRAGSMYDARFGTRMTGQGEYAMAIGALFERTAKRVGLRTCRTADDRSESEPRTFERPHAPRGQLKLF